MSSSPNRADDAGASQLARDLAAGEPAGNKPLQELIDRLEARHLLNVVMGPAAGDVVTGIALDSRQIVPGSVFVAVPGEHVDGHDFVAAAARNGAVAAIVERPVRDTAIRQIVVKRSAAALAWAAGWWYGDPSYEIGVIGVTGTDGKTTTSFIATSVLEAGGISTGLITTAEMKIGVHWAANPEHVTTPQAPALQRAVRAMVVAGNHAAIVETTSHGLALERVAGIAYDIGIFTNLTHEHLELHGTFEAYREAKTSLFGRLGEVTKSLDGSWPRTGIVNADDASAPYFEAAARSRGARLIRYGLGDGAEVRAVDVQDVEGRPAFEVRTPRWRGRIALPLIGRFNVHNGLAAIALGEALELDPQSIRRGVEGASGVPGRMERIDCGQPFGVIVDYAHSPASLTTVLDQLGSLARARGGGVIAVFGSAGERDVKKRPMMGRIAGERCRLVVVTDEDPRGEDREAILAEIGAGAEAAGKHRGDDLLLIADRREAIVAAFERASPGDVVLLAGKGHEQSIIMAAGSLPWDEKTEALAALARMGYFR
jgi:UDP-N-acetylmuramoyl-L-alanyl-D-glutamate--2,6-diaminopimelate ligase